MLMLAAPSEAQKPDPGLGDAIGGLLKTGGAPEPEPSDIDTDDVEPFLVPGGGRPIPGQYIVTLRPARTCCVRDRARLEARQHGGTVEQVFRHVFQGFVGRFSAAEVAGLRRDPSVLRVEADRVVTAVATQYSPPRGLDRLDQRLRPLNGTYTYSSEGEGVHAYIIDSGVLLNHAQFTGRIGNGFDSITPGGSANDCSGHGTHVAGTVAGTDHGVAKRAIVHPVRVVNCSGAGSSSGLIAGLDWVRANHVKPAVVNMSLATNASSSVDAATVGLIDAGVTVVAAAGNYSTSACSYSPARVAAVVTVGATTDADDRAYFSNYGTCLDVFAPGTDVLSAWHTDSTATRTSSGTSMAAPHVAGVAALALSGRPTASPAEVRELIVSVATKGIVTAAGTGSPNALLHSVLTAPAPAPPPEQTTAAGVVNGGFESGPTAGWTASTRGIVSSASQASKVRTGSYSAWLAGYDGAKDHIEQKISVPRTGNTLTYHWHMTSQEATDQSYDYMYVRAYSTAGALLATLRMRSNTAARNAWYADSLSLSAWAGQDILLRFAAVSDGSVTTSFFLDDVSLG